MVSFYFLPAVPLRNGTAPKVFHSPHSRLLRYVDASLDRPIDPPLTAEEVLQERPVQLFWLRGLYLRL